MNRHDDGSPRPPTATLRSRNSGRIGYSPKPPNEKMIRFRNWLRSHPSDRKLYEQTKQHLAAQTWKYVQNYADAKSNVIQTIMSRARQM